MALDSPWEYLVTLHEDVKKSGGKNLHIGKYRLRTLPKRGYIACSSVVSFLQLCNLLKTYLILCSLTKYSLVLGFVKKVDNSFCICNESAVKALSMREERGVNRFCVTIDFLVKPYWVTQHVSLLSIL